MTLAVGQRTRTQDVAKVRIQGVYAGKPAPDFEATTLDGQPFKLSTLRGKVVLLDFWATWCAPCIAELPNVQKAHEQYADDGLVIVGISFDRDAGTLRKYVADKQIAWLQIWAEKADKGPLADLYGVSAVPTTFLIGPDGKVVDKDLGGDALHHAIQDEMRKLKKLALQSDREVRYLGKLRCPPQAAREAPLPYSDKPL